MNVRWVVAAIIAAAVGCSDSSGPSALIGSLTFSYTGAGGSPFTATGAMPLEETAETANWAAGFRVEDAGVLVMAQRSMGNAGADVVFLGVDRQAIGTSAIPEGDCTAEICAGLAAILGTDGRLCALESGSVSATEVTDKRMKGTFEGTGTCLTFGAETTDTVAFAVTTGSFDVPLRSDFPLGFRRFRPARSP